MTYDRAGASARVSGARARMKTSPKFVTVLSRSLIVRSGALIELFVMIIPYQ